MTWPEDPPLFGADEFAGLSQWGDNTRSFVDVIAAWNRKRLILPVHQRDGHVWPPRKRQAFVERLKGARHGGHPPGAFATYQVAGDGDSPHYLNDGLQRLTTLLEMHAHPSRYNLDQASADRLLELSISTQHRWYRSHEDAMADFALINNGTPLTAYELGNGILKYMDGYDVTWEPLVQDAYGAVQDSKARLAVKDRGDREQDHKRRRDIYAICHRFLTSERALSEYPDLGSRDWQRYADREQTVEHRLRRILEDLGPDKASDCIRIFRTFMDAETSILEICLAEARETAPQIQTMTAGVHHWLIHLAVWRRFNTIGRDAHRKFVVHLLAKAADGYWSQPMENGKPFKTTFGAAKLGILPRLAELSGMPEFCAPARRSRAPRTLKLGYDSSHIEPYVTNGDGPTFPEPAALNRARGAQPAENPPVHSPDDQENPS